MVEIICHKDECVNHFDYSRCSCKQIIIIPTKDFGGQRYNPVCSNFEEKETKQEG